jgi:hypothetical protein
VFIELRDKNTISTVLASTFALLQRDGDIVAIDGVSAVSFATVFSNDYYVSIIHRNHIAVVKDLPITITKGTPVNIDFTNDINSIRGGVNAMKELKAGVYGLFSGDFNSSGQVQQADITGLLPFIGTSGYMHGDVDMNGQVQNTDITLQILINMGKGKQF